MLQVGHSSSRFITVMNPPPGDGEVRLGRERGDGDGHWRRDGGGRGGRSAGQGRRAVGGGAWRRSAQRGGGSERG